MGMDERAKRYDMGPVLDSLTVPISCLSGKSKDDIQMFNGLNIFIDMAGHSYLIIVSYACYGVGVLFSSRRTFFQGERKST